MAINPADLVFDVQKISAQLEPRLHSQTASTAHYIRETEANVSPAHPRRRGPVTKNAYIQGPPEGTKLYLLFVVHQVLYQQMIFSGVL